MDSSAIDWLDPYSFNFDRYDYVRRCVDRYLLADCAPLGTHSSDRSRTGLANDPYLSFKQSIWSNRQFQRHHLFIREGVCVAVVVVRACEDSRFVT
jgi:hypothetical protein